MIQKDIKDMTETELKALAYDLVCQLELTKNNLQTVNQSIQRKQQENAAKTPVETNNDSAS